MVENTGINYYWNIFKENSNILMKATTEYKFNLMNQTILHVVFTIFPLFFGYVIVDNFNMVLKWTYADFIICLFFSKISVAIMGHATWGKEVNKAIISGELNTYLIRPGKRFFNFYIMSKSNGLFFFIIDLFLLFPIVFYLTNFNILNILLAIIIYFFISLAFIIVRIFIDSISFFSFGISRSIYKGFFSPTYNTTRLYPGIFFENTKIKYLIMFAPIYFVSILINPIFYDTYIFGFDYWLNFLILILMIIFFSMGTYFLWKKGLQKYSAYN